MKRIIILMVLAILVLACGKEAWAGKDKFTDEDAQVDPLADDDVILGVDTSDTTDDPAGSSVKITMGQIKTYIDALTSTDIGTTVQDCPAEGCFEDGDKTKLGGIETAADVTDATNVDAAGAVMNSDYTSTAVDLTGSNPYDIVPTANIRHENLRVSGGDDLNVLTFNETGAFSLKIISVTDVDAALKQRVAHSAGNVEQGGYAVDIYPGQTAYWIYINDRYYYIGGGVTTQTFSSMAIASIAHFANADAIYNDNTTPHVLTDGETKGKILTNCGATEDRVYTMPAYSFGMNFMVQVCAAFQMDLEPPSGDNIILNGTAAANDEHIINAADTPGDVMSCWTIESSNGVYDLYCKSDNANWAETTPP